MVAVALAVRVLDGAAGAVDDQRVFALGPVESGFLLVVLAFVLLVVHLAAAKVVAAQRDTTDVPRGATR